MRHFLIMAFAALALCLCGSAVASNKVNPKATWHRHCVKSAHFCASFPYSANDPYGTDYKHYPFHGASALSSKGLWESAISLSKKGRLCRSPIACADSEFYSVMVFKSKYTDPWTALTALNGGVKDPVRTTFQGALAVRFRFAGGQCLAVYHRGMVYYAETGVNGKDEPHYWRQFFHSIKLT